MRLERRHKVTLHRIILRVSVISTLTISALYLVNLTQGGSSGLRNYVVDLSSRVQQELSDDEARELAFLECLDRRFRELPESSRISLVFEAYGNEYFYQRLVEVAFPRLIITSNSPDYIVLVRDNKSLSDDGELSKETCGDLRLDFKNNG